MYNLQIEDFKKVFSVNETKNSLIHTRDKAVKVFPFNSKYTAKHREEQKQFTKAISEFSQLLADIKLSKNVDFSEEQLITRALDQVQATPDDKVELKLMLKALFFESETLNFFHPKIMSYRQGEVSSFNKDVAEFLYENLGMNESCLKTDFKRLLNKQPDNVLELLMLSSLPPLEVTTGYDAKFLVQSTKVKTLFQKDLQFILQYPETFMQNFHNLIEYYYFFTVSQMLTNLSQFFDANLDVITEYYFTLETEKVSKTRLTYENGWRMIESHTRKSFTHTNVLQVLNASSASTGEYVDYVTLSAKINQLNELEYAQLLATIKQIQGIYQHCSSDINWQNYQSHQFDSDELKNEIQELFWMIDYQFNQTKTDRSRVAKDYATWFQDFSKKKYLKQRGQLGYILTLKQEDLLFLVKLCIGNEERMKLTDVYQALQQRGIKFDQASQGQVNELFEKINLIEKKSDSGDAQYVRAIL
ncbi:MAG: DNA phosphorothioation-dependent restriction protein DptG [Culicoidibacterales bacterium]